LLFPSGDSYASEETNWGKGYEIYTVNETLLHAQFLVENFYKMPLVSVDEIDVFSPSLELDDVDSTYLTVPQLTIMRSPDDGDDSEVSDNDENDVIEKYDLHNATSGWPLSAEGALQIAANYPADPIFLSDFFENLIQMKFELMVKTDGYTGADLSNNYRLCVYWRVSIIYEKGARGQISVSLVDDPVERCDELPYDNQLTSVTWAIAVLSGLYQLLLLKSVVHSYNILKLIFQKKSIAKENEEERLKSRESGERTGGGNGGANSPWSRSPVLGAMNSVSSWLRRGACKSDVGNNNNINNNNKTNESENMNTPLISDGKINVDKNKLTREGIHESTRTRKKSQLLKRAKLKEQAQRAEAAWKSLSFRDKYL